MNFYTLDQIQISVASFQFRPDQESQQVLLQRSLQETQDNERQCYAPQNRLSDSSPAKEILLVAVDKWTICRGDAESIQTRHQDLHLCPLHVSL